MKHPKDVDVPIFLDQICDAVMPVQQYANVAR